MDVNVLFAFLVMIQGNSTINQYVLTSKLGEGAYGKVKLGIKGKKEEKFAIKILKKTSLRKKKEMYRDEKGSITVII